ncbi:MAG TPA: TlpA family protein disulfide reductase [Clostridiaceae bacterium]|nr:TlpA family protein disulfide reductase [Clostridiaceae bacterium]
MKKITILLLSVLFLVLVFSSCSAKVNEVKNKINNLTKQTSSEESEKVETSEELEKAEESEELGKTESSENTEKPEYSEKSELTSDSIWFFESTDFTGNEFNSQTYFANSKLTFVNVWATWCPPCKAELPDLGKLANDFADQDVQFLGIASDVLEDDQNTLDIAKSLLADSAVDYPNVKFNEQINYITQQYRIQSIPTTILIDANGNVIGDLIIGMRSYEEFANLINSSLEQID